MQFNCLNIEVVQSNLWWIALVGIEVRDYHGHLFYLENNEGEFKFDLLWMRPLLLKMKDKISKAE
jgi:hypothetical protein